MMNPLLLMIALLACAPADAPACLPLGGSCLPGQSGYAVVSPRCEVAGGLVCLDAGTCSALEVWQDGDVVGWSCGEAIGDVQVELVVRGADGP